jgi:hypothetical protein
MLRHGRPAQIEMASQIAGGTRPVCQQLEQLSPHRVGQGEEHVVGHATQITSDIPDMSTIPDASTPITVAPPRPPSRARMHGEMNPAKPCLPPGAHTPHAPLATFRERSQPLAWAKPCLAPGPTLSRTASHVPRTSRTHRSQPPENDHDRTHGRSPVWRAHMALVPLPTCRHATQTSMWAKPCLAGRPTALVRTQCCETNTSRSRPSGMELPDYPVVVLTPTPKDQDGPALRPPARSFPRFVSRYASRRVFSRIRSSFCSPPGLSQIRSSFCSPPGLFPDS